MLLEATELPVYEIAATVGISETSRFCRVFKELTGLTPGNYRLEARSKVGAQYRSHAETTMLSSGKVG